MRSWFSTEKELWELSAGEKRLLLITFAEGLASILLGAAMIGAALALARWEHAKHQSVLSLAILTLTCLGFGVRLFDKRMRPPKLNPRSVTFRIIAGIGLLIICDVVLWWIGAAAGVK